MWKGGGKVIQRLHPTNLVQVGCTVLLAGLVLYPLFWLFMGSFQSDPRSFSFTFKAYTNILAVPFLGEIIFNTAAMAVGATALAVLMGVPMAWIVGRTDTPFKELLTLVALIPFITPPLVGAISWYYLATPNVGYINVFWKWVTGSTVPIFDIFTLKGLIWVMGLYVTPYVFIFTSIALRNMDPALENAAYVAGGGPLSTTLRVTLPLVAPAILSGALLAFIQSLEMFAIPAAIGVPGDIYVFTTEIWRMLLGLPPKYAEAAALCVPLFLVSGLALWGQYRFMGKGRQYTTVGGKGHRPRVISLGRWRYVALAFTLFYLLMSTGLPYLTLIYGSLIKARGLAPTWENLTLLHLWEVIAGDSRPLVFRAIKNSLILGFAGATLGVGLSTVVAYVIHRTRWRGRAFLDFLSLIPLAIPGAVIAIGLLWAYVRPPFELYGTLTILLLAYITRFVPFGVRAVGNSILQVSEELEKAAYVSGAPWGTMFRKILVPLLLPGIVAGWVLIFVSMMRELSASIMLYGFQKETLAVALFLIWDEGRFEYVSILALLIAFLSLVPVALVRRFVRLDETREIF
ncbi:MAG: iron ABC transporter permease [Nitrospinota bacterium]|jgi:iron(III) transport system permease protein|nr:iron ABC transporter permease [Nitrospinota bacterium]